MTMTPYPPFDARLCNPSDFLGREIALPEMGGLTARRHLESPVLSVDDLIAFGEGAAFAESFYRQWLDPDHWGVWHARVLEAAFWRLQDAASPSPRLPHAWGDRFWKPHDGGSVPSLIELHLDSATRHSVQRMSQSWCRLGEGTDAFLELPQKGPGNEWPDVATPEETQELADLRQQQEACSWKTISGLSLLEDALAWRAREAFWRPIGVWALADSLNAWDACRMGKNRFSVTTLAYLNGDWRVAFGNTFGAGAAAALRADALGNAWPEPSLEVPSRPRM